VDELAVVDVGVVFTGKEKVPADYTLIKKSVEQHKGEGGGLAAVCAERCARSRPESRLGRLGRLPVLQEGARSRGLRSQGAL
jgi:hypothetical protein